MLGAKKNTIIKMETDRDGLINSTQLKESASLWMQWEELQMKTQSKKRERKEAPEKRSDAER